MYEFAVTPAVTQLRRPGVTIESIDPGTIADDLGLGTGDRIVKINGRTVRDYLDFRFQTSGETELIFVVKKPNGETWEVDIERDEGEDFGLNFEQIIPRQCANECIFCFCKGNPQDARPSLFVRDEDIRLSFLYGNYTTLSSITEDEMTRIIEQRLSPQYVSVHATDLETRAYLLGVEKAKADISGKLRRLLENNIELHAQVVLCPEINDGPILEKTLSDLADLHPGVVSTAVVPVALTRYNKDERLTRVTPEFCRRTIGQVEILQEGFRKELGTRFAFLGDEIYQKAGVAIPSRDHYGDYPQIEDGVGMIRTFLDDFGEFLGGLRNAAGPNGVCGDAIASEADQRRARKREVRTHPFAVKPLAAEQQAPPPRGRLNGTILTGEMFAPVLSDLIGELNGIIGSDLAVLAVPNTYFGGDVAVAGLITGQDIVAIRNELKGDFVIVPEQIVKSDEPILLDGMKVEDLRESIGLEMYSLDLQGLKTFISTGIPGTNYSA